MNKDMISDDQWSLIYGMCADDVNQIKNCTTAYSKDLLFYISIGATSFLKNYEYGNQSAIQMLDSLVKLEHMTAFGIITYHHFKSRDPSVSNEDMAQHLMTFLTGYSECSRRGMYGVAHVFARTHDYLSKNDPDVLQCVYDIALDKRKAHEMEDCELNWSHISYLFAPSLAHDDITKVSPSFYLDFCDQFENEKAMEHWIRMNMMNDTIRDFIQSSRMTNFMPLLPAEEKKKLLSKEMGM